MDELSDDMHSSMPSLEIMGSTPSMEVSSFSDVQVIGIHAELTFFYSPRLLTEMTAFDMASISALDEVD